jgi:hypothetical protein
LVNFSKGKIGPANLSLSAYAKSLEAKPKPNPANDMLLLQIAAANKNNWEFQIARMNMNIQYTSGIVHFYWQARSMTS